jgi:hypothetical protein
MVNMWNGLRLGGTSNVLFELCNWHRINFYHINWILCTTDCYTKFSIYTTQIRVAQSWSIYMSYIYILMNIQIYKVQASEHIILSVSVTRSYIIASIMHEKHLLVVKRNYLLSCNLTEMQD